MAAKSRPATSSSLPPKTPLPLTTQQRLECIEQLRQRVNGYVELVCRIDSLQGASAEAKDKAVAAFHERLAVLERQLGRIHEELSLA